MTRLDLGNLVEPEETAWYCLNDGPVASGILGTQYEQVLQPGETVTEMLRLGLSGTPTEMRAIISRLEEFCQQASLYQNERRGLPLYLRVFPADNSEPLVSRLLSVELQAQPSALAFEERGSMALDLIIKRENAFFGAEQPLTLTNTAGSGITANLKNYDDDLAPGNDNYFYVPTESLGSDLPAPVHLQITNTGNAPLQQLLVGVYHAPDHLDKPPLVLEGEAAPEGSVISNSAASHGAYGQFMLSGGAWCSLASWELSETMLETMGGRLFLPIVRFFSSPVAGILQFRVALSFPGLPPALGTTLYQSSAVSRVENQRYLLLQPVRMPFGELPLRFPPAAVRFTLQTFSPTTGNQTIAIDDILLLPQEEFAWFISSAGLPAGARLIDDAFAQQTYTLVNYQELHTHQRLGAWLSLPSGKASWFFFFQVNADGIAPIDLPITVKTWYRRKRQVL